MPWVTEAMRNKTDERRKWENVSTEEGKTKYRELNNEVRRATDQTREQWWEEQCRTLTETIYFFYFFYCKYLLFNLGASLNIFRNFPVLV